MTASTHRPRAAVIGLAAIVAVVGVLVDHHGHTAGFAFLGFAFVLAEQIGFSISDGLFVTLGPALVIPLVRSAANPSAPGGDTVLFVVVIVLGTVLGTVAREGTRPTLVVARDALHHAAGAFAGYGAYAAVEYAMHDRGDRAPTLLSLTAAVAAVLLVDVAHHGARRWLDLAGGGGGRAYAVLATCGALMALGVHGIDGRKDAPALGMLAVVLFSIPLLAAWYSFSRVDAVRQTTVQTIRALSIVPERAELSPAGHSERVAHLAEAMARQLGLGPRDRESLEQAALLHHLGHVCLDDLDERGLPYSPADVTETTARMLRETGHLAEAARVLDAAALHHRGKDASVPPETRLAAQILKVASDFDDLTGGDATHRSDAIESLYSAPGYVYDPRVLASLEHVFAEIHLV